MTDSLIVAIAALVTFIASLFFYIPKLRERKRYDRKYKRECDHVSDKPHLEEPWYRPPDNGLATAKTWMVSSFLVLVAASIWTYAVAV